jgi:hypothetical protein
MFDLLHNATLQPPSLLPPPSYTPITMFTINVLFVYISCILHIYVKNVIKMYSYFAIWKKSQNKMSLFNYKRLFGGCFSFGQITISFGREKSFVWAENCTLYFILAEIKYIKRVDFGSVTCMVLHQSPMWHKLGHCYWQNLNIYCLEAYLTSEQILPNWKNNNFGNLPKWNVPVVRYCWQLFLRHLFLLEKLMHYFVEEFKKWFLLQCKRRNGTHFI